MKSWNKMRSTLPWLPQYAWQRLSPRPTAHGTVHLIICLADHFEPSFDPESPKFADPREQNCRLDKWCREYPKALNDWRDVDGWPLRHTYFYPAEHYDKDLIVRLAEHCQAGWGEIEIHLHHGIERPDTSDNTRRIIVEFRDALARVGCLSFESGQETPRFAFVHGNWALANSAGGRWCGVDDELAILAEAGCYADMTLPSAPDSSQVAKINSIYECSTPLDQRAPHRKGLDLMSGRSPTVLPLIIQGPLMLNFAARKMAVFPSIENSEISNANPPTLERARLWRKAGITVKGLPEWVFIKLHTHGMDPRAQNALLGQPMQQFLDSLLHPQKGNSLGAVHFVTAREMVNIALAACDGKDGDPANYRDYRLKPVQCLEKVELSKEICRERFVSPR